VEFRQLAYFEAVARLDSFTRAAQQLHVAQPAVSAQIRRLERELGTALFTRTTRRVTLTQAGSALLARVRTVLDELDGARADLDRLGAVLRGQLRLGITPILGSLDLPGLLVGFHRRYPDVTLAVTTGLVADLLTQLDAGDVDALLAPIHSGLAARYEARPLVTETLTLITAPGRLAQHPRPTSLADVRDQPFVCLPAGSGLRTILTTTAAEHGFVPHVPFEAPDPATIRRFVAAGLGVALLAESAATCAGPDVDVHRLKPAPPHPPIGLIRLREPPPGPTLRAWVEHLQGRSNDRA
jgi:DNA-binding transcriptional LysR family regulator